MAKIKVAVNGYGTIGKRVADAVLMQEDMVLSGITGHSFNYRLEQAARQGIPVYSLDSGENLRKSGIEISGTIKDLLDSADIVVDAVPKPIGSENIEKIYRPAGVKAIVQGGEKKDCVQASFVAQCNYEEAIGKDYVRVVSCNTTGLSRSISALKEAFGVVKARATLIRRAADPSNVKRGPINAILPSFELPSHHGPDVRTVLHDTEVFTTAVVVPTTVMHMHNLNVVLENKPEIDDVIKAFCDAPRIRVIPKGQQLNSTAELMELARDLGYKRGDMNELCVWEEGIGLYEGELFFPQAVHQESIVIPENIDAIRAMSGYKDKEKSIRKTDESLGII